MMRRLLYKGRRALVILPFVSICEEKLGSLEKVWGDLVRIEGRFGNRKGSWHPAMDVCICTPEK